jgi:membrane protein
LILKPKVHFNFKRFGTILWRSFRDMPLDNGFQWAAAMAYYCILSIIPLLLAAITVTAYFTESDWIVTQARHAVGELLPPGDTRLQSFVQNALKIHGSATLLTILALLITSSRVFSMLRRALNIAYCTYEIHRYIKRTFIETIMALTLGLLFIAALFSRFFFKMLLASFGMMSAENYLLFRLSMEVLSAFALGIVYFLLYSRVSHRRLHPKATLIGATTAVCMILIVRPFFMQYIRNFTDYTVTYGSLALAAILLFWFWITAVITLYGGEVASHYHDMAIENMSAEDVRLIHLDRSATYTNMDFKN